MARVGGKGLIMYFITCMTKCEEINGFFNGGSLRCFGYKETLEKAEQALNENCCDMHEYIYQYAVIEKLGPYIHPEVEEEYWFKYDKEKDGFFRIEKPEATHHTCNYALG